MPTTGSPASRAWRSEKPTLSTKAGSSSSTAAANAGSSTSSCLAHPGPLRALAGVQEHRPGTGFRVVGAYHARRGLACRPARASPVTASAWSRAHTVAMVL